MSNLGGGLQLCLDIDKAFDSVSRSKLLGTMRRHGIAADEASLFTSWHANTSYISCQHPAVAVRSNVGVRQGCVAAPLLWNMYIHDFLQLIRKIFSDDWLNQHVTVFADDFHLFFSFDSEDGIRKSLWELRRFLDELGDHGLRVNMGKTAFMCHLRGLRAPKWRRKLLRGSGCSCRFRLEANTKHGEVLFIPFVSQHKYLGIMLGYRHGQSATLRLRIQAAQGTFSRLRRWWGANFPLKQRIKLWFQTVWPTLIYGLADVGCSPRGLQQFMSLALRHLRQLARSPVHLTRESNEALCMRLGVQNPADHLCKIVYATWAKRLERISSAHPDDILKQIPQMCHQAVCAGKVLLPLVATLFAFLGPNGSCQQRSSNHTPSLSHAGIGGTL